MASPLRPRTPLWNDSAFTQDAWFDTRAEAEPAASEFGMLHAANEFPGPDDFDDPLDTHHDEPHQPRRRARR